MSTMMGNGATAEVVAALREKADAAQVPVFVVLTRTPPAFAGRSQVDEELVSLVHAELGLDGLYYVHTSLGAGHFEAYGDLDPSVDNDAALYSLARYTAADQVDAAIAAQWSTARVVAPTAEAGMVLDVAGLPPVPDYQEPVLPDEQVELYTGSAWTEAGFVYGGRGDETEPLAPGLGALLGVTVALCAGVLAYRLLRTATGRGEERRERGAGAAAELERARALAAEALAELESDLDSDRAAGPGVDLELALGSRDAARDVLDDRRAGLLDLVGAEVLARTGRSALDPGQTLYRCCFVDPRHGRGRHEAEVGGGLSVPVCRPCRRHLERHETPVALGDGRRGRPYYEGDSVWARTGYGTLTDTLWSDVARERAR
ncbi:hypothetical protein ABFT23_20635 [Nocardioides sp. C4-1]|uniref:hypothetical protein n=1 Tax=Nocardioides sp. C4-1 TaxID=3151851 RepID=UPI003265A04A